MTSDSDAHLDTATGETASVEDGSESTYDLLRRRLRTVAEQVSAAAQGLNDERSETFASQPLALAEQDRVRTDVACVPCDAVCVNDLMLFGYNVPPGLATDRSVADVLSLYRLVPLSATDWSVDALAVGEAGYFLADPSFQRDFGEIYKYYADARLLALTVVGDELLMVFGVGTAESDVRVLRWRLRKDGIAYLDAFGDRDMAERRQFDFVWTEVGRDKLADGRWPHLAIEGQLFVGLSKGTLEFRIDDAVLGGRTILSEQVSEIEQDVAELRVGAARLGDLVLVRIQPYRENSERFYVYNRLTRETHRVDALGRGCHQLPEGQGIVFPGGFHLQNGEHRVFSGDAGGLSLESSVVSPNGEDILYVYSREHIGGYQILTYNVVRREMSVPIPCHGYSLFADGVLVTLRESAEAQRVHTISIYTSPFCSVDRYVMPVASDSFFGRIGNAELVHGIAECLAIGRDAVDTPFNAANYEALIARATKVIDTFSWLQEESARGLGSLLVQLRKAAGSILDEFAAVATAKRDALARTADVERAIADLRASVELDQRDVQVFIELVAQSRVVQGRIVELSETRHVERPQLDALRANADDCASLLGSKALVLLAQPDAFTPLAERLATAERDAAAAPSTGALDPPIAAVGEVGERTSLLADVVGGLDVRDPTEKTAVLSRLSDLLARRNAVVAAIENRRIALQTTEKSAGFQASVAVLNQRVTSSLLSVKDAPGTDRAYNQTLAELENIELSYGDVPEFAAVLAEKRTEITDGFAAKREAINTERGALIERVVGSAGRVLETATTRGAQMPDLAALEGFFAADPLVLRVRKAIDDLNALGESARAAELAVLLRSARDTARRTLRDRADLLADGMVRIGRRTFGVNEEAFDLRLLPGPNGNGLELRLTGTDLRLRVDDPELAGFADVAGQTYVSETPWISRSVFLAFEAQRLDRGGDVRVLATQRLEDGYEIGVHDADAEIVLAACEPVFASAGLWFDGVVRAVAGMWFGSLGPRERADVDSGLRAVRAFGPGTSRAALIERFGGEITAVADGADLLVDVGLAIDYLVVAADVSFQVSQGAADRAMQLQGVLERAGLDVRQASFGELVRWARDAAPPNDPLPVGVAAEMAWRLRVPAVGVATGVPDAVEVAGLLARHVTVHNGGMLLDVGTAYTRYLAYITHERDRVVAFQRARRVALERWRSELRVSELRPKVLSSFVRNRLVDEVYLPLIGENLARQLGVTGASQGMLLLVSPPGYGKTTLVEYVAELLGMALVRVSGPALGSSVTSLDPGAAPDAASASELMKLNRALGMGTNVMLYVDDIQHLSAEFLQRFIPLCDATRRIEGVLNGGAQTFDLAGRRFAVVMAGNPYTSTGAAFRIPDMLANRADVHNLGEVSAANGDAFAQSYLENACGVNDVLAPVLARGREDLERFLGAAGGDVLHSDQLTHPYTAAEVGNIVKVLQSMARVRDALLRVNSAYIRSASMDDAMRGEPAFQLQGSYRNMARVAGQILPAATPAEVNRLIAEHYRAEAQTLGASARWNLAKLREVLGVANPDGMALIDDLRDRWRAANVGSDPLQVIAGSLRDIAASIRAASATPVGDRLPEVT